jgi:hypothetical protein
MSWLFWWAADAYQQPEIRGCLTNAGWIMGLMALIVLIYTLIWGG